MTVLALMMLLGAAGGLSIETAGRCPEAEAVSRQLEGLLPAPAEAAVETRRVLLREQRNGVLRLSLLDTEGQVVAERTVAVRGCDERAQAAAVIVAAWQSRLRTTTESAAIVTPSAVALTQPAPAAPAGARIRLTELGVGAWVAATATSVAPGAVAFATLGRGGPLRPLVGASAGAAQRQPVGAGSISWSRWTALLGAETPVAGFASAALEAGGALALARTRLVGAGFDENARGTRLDPGLAVQLRAHATGRAGAWLSLSTLLWPRAQRIVVSGSSAWRDLPRWEFSLGAGVSWSAR
jgi:hypothetical protein